MIDLTTQYLGLKLKNPLVASPSPLCEDLDHVRHMEDAGASAVVLHSLFEEQISIHSEQLDWSLELGAESFPEFSSHFPDMTSYNLGPDGYLDHIRKAKEAVGIPIIASLNGITPGGWTRYAKYMEEAGADALELNIYNIPNDPEVTGAQIERIYRDMVLLVKSQVHIPVAVKLHPFFSSLPNMARVLDAAGVNGIVFFNRFYQPDFDLQSMEVVPHLVLSTSNELLMRLHWTAIIYGTIHADIAVTGGIHTGADALKAMMAGGRVAMMTSSVLRQGIHHFTTVLKDMEDWMVEHEYQSVREMQGSMSRRNVARPEMFERANYMKTIGSYSHRAAMH